MQSPEDGLKRFLAIETAGGPSWHPSSSKFAFVYDAGGYFRVYSTEVDEGRAVWPERITYAQNRCTEPKYLADGTLLFTMDIGGNENFQIGHIDRRGNLQWISTDPAAKHWITLVDNTSFFYVANIADKSRFDVYRYALPIESNSAETLYHPKDGVMRPVLASDDKKHVILSQDLGNTKENLWMLNIDEGTAFSLTEDVNQRDTRWEACKFLDNSHIVVTTDHLSDLNRLALLTTDGDFLEFSEQELKFRGPVEQTATCADSPFLYFAINEDGYSRLFRALFDHNSMKETVEIQLPTKGVLQYADERSFSNGMSLSPDGKKLALTLSSSTEPTNIWILNTITLNMWKATNVQMAGRNPSDFSSALLNRFHSFDGLDVPYFIYYPKGEMPQKGWPVIIIVHGGPEAQSRPEFNPVIQFYVSAGFCVITPNVRGSSGYGRTYLDLDNVEKRLDGIRDIKSLHQHIQRNDSNVDSSRAVIYGGSYGGYAVLASITEHPELWKAAVDIVGISNFVTFLQNTASWRRALREQEYGSLEHDYELLKSLSPINRVERIQCPLFIIQGDNDERVPLSESIGIYEAVTKRGLSARLLRFADEGHGLSKLENRIKAYSEVLSWLKKIV
jgi:dipeptidyl aminopeptidase/acylaminoacyl peptidase